jgi:WhiB family redox-sensing transcriptional regulator
LPNSSSLKMDAADADAGRSCKPTGSLTSTWSRSIFSEAMRWTTARFGTAIAARRRPRAICLRRCPLAQQRQCARQAVEAGEEYGVWAGVKLPGGQYRKRNQLAHAREVLRKIADGVINPRELPESVDLLSRAEALPTAVAAGVVHVPLAVRPSTAA